MGLVSVLQVDLHAEFDDATGGQTEIRGGRSSISRDEGEEDLTPAPHLASAGREKSFATEVITRAAQFDGEAVIFAGEEDVRHVGRLHEAVTGVNAEKPLALIFDGDAFVERNFGYAFVRDRKKYDLFVEHLVVLEVMQENGRSAVWIRRHEHGGAANAVWCCVADVGQELFER